MYLFVSSLNGLSLTFQVEDVEAVLIVSLVPPGEPPVVGVDLVTPVLGVEVGGVDLLQHGEVLISPCRD